MVAGDERAHLAARHLQIVLGGVEISFHAGHVGVELVDVLSVGLGGELGVHRALEPSELLIDRSG